MQAIRHTHAVFYVGLAHAIEPLFIGSTQLTALTRLEAERANIRAAYRHLIALGEVDAVADAVWRLTLYWWIRAALVGGEGLDARDPERRRSAHRSNACNRIQLFRHGCPFGSQSP